MKPEIKIGDLLLSSCTRKEQLHLIIDIRREYKQEYRKNLNIYATYELTVGKLREIWETSIIETTWKVL